MSHANAKWSERSGVSCFYPSVRKYPKTVNEAIGTQYQSAQVYKTLCFGKKEGAGNDFFSTTVTDWHVSIVVALHLNCDDGVLLACKLAIKTYF